MHRTHNPPPPPPPPRPAPPPPPPPSQLVDSRSLAGVRLWFVLAVSVAFALVLLAGGASAGSGRQAIVRVYEYDGGPLIRSTMTGCLDPAEVPGVEVSMYLLGETVSIEWRDCALPEKPKPQADVGENANNSPPPQQPPPQQPPPQQPLPLPPPQQPTSTTQPPPGITEFGPDLPDPEDLPIGGPVGGDLQPKQQTQTQTAQTTPGGCPLPDLVQGTTGGCKRVMSTQPGGTVSMPCMAAPEATNFMLALESTWAAGGTASLKLVSCGERQADWSDADDTNLICRNGATQAIRDAACPPIPDPEPTRGSQPPYSDRSIPDCSPGSDLRTRHDALIADGEESNLCPD